MLSAPVPPGVPVFHGEPGAAPARVTGAEAHHAATVRRVRVGERVVVSDGAGAGVLGAVLRVSRQEVLVDVERALTEPEPEPRLVVVQALVKGETGTAAVGQLTEVGVDTVVPWSAGRSVVRVEGDRRERLRERWAAAAREAAKQARRLRVPDVAPLASTADVAARLRAAGLAVVLHEAAERPLAVLQVPSRGEVVVVVGPEGGISDAEVEQLGGATARLGPTVLRAAHAGAAAAAVLLSRTARWGA